jgi:hypothetical protein
MEVERSRCGKLLPVRAFCIDIAPPPKSGAKAEERVYVRRGYGEKLSSPNAAVQRPNALVKPLPAARPKWPSIKPDRVRLR